MSNMSNLRLILPALLMSLASLAAWYGFGDDSPTLQAEPERSSHPVVTIEIRKLEFLPSEVIVAPGTTVQWINVDPVDHDVTSGVSLTGRKTRGMKQTKFPDAKFSSGLFGSNKTFSFTFGEKGEYPYYCNIHPFMSARVIVR